MGRLRKEFKQIKWPSIDFITKNSLSVIITTVIIGCITLLIDFGVQTLLNVIF